MNTRPTYSIKYVSSQTGLKPYLIRSWEARYNAVCPRRSSNKRRCFTDDDITRLRLLKQAVDRGHTISAVAALSDGDLRDLLGHDARGIVSDASGSHRLANHPAGYQATAEQVVKASLTHIMQLDTAALERALTDASVDMPRQTFLQDVVMPLFESIGERWRAGSLKIIYEHMASMIVRSILWDMLRGVDTTNAAPKIVVATPVGHWHEFGALASALTASESGWRVCYFGPNLPPEEIVYAVKRLKARALALSLCHRLNDAHLIPGLKKLRRMAGKALPIFVGGPGSESLRKTNTNTGVIVCGDLITFRDRLEKLTRRS